MDDERERGRQAAAATAEAATAEVADAPVQTAGLEGGYSRADASQLHADCRG